MAPRAEFLISEREVGSTSFNVMFGAGTPCFRQKCLAALFGEAKGVSSEHIFEGDGWTPEATVRLFRTVQIEGGREVTREVEHYNLDLLLSLGLRVHSPVGERFRGSFAPSQAARHCVAAFGEELS